MMAHEGPRVDLPTMAAAVLAEATWEIEDLLVAVEHPLSPVGDGFRKSAPVGGFPQP